MVLAVEHQLDTDTPLVMEFQKNREESDASWGMAEVEEPRRTLGNTQPPPS